MTVTRRQAVIAGIVAVLVLAAAVALLVVSGHGHRAPHKLLVGDAPSSTTSTIASSTSSDLATTTTTGRAAAPAPPKRTSTTLSTAYTGPRGGIAFVAGGNPNGIAIMDADGSHVRRVADFDARKTSFAGDDSPQGGNAYVGVTWNPAADLLAAAVAGKYGGGLEVMRPDGTGRLTLVRGQALKHPSFSADGKWIVFDQWGQADPAVEHDQVVIIGVDGRNQRSLGDGVPTGDPAWSPHDNEIAIAASKLTIVRPDGSRLGEIAGPAGTTLSDPAWSPDGTWISFTATTTGSYPAYTSDVYKVHPDGSGMVRVTDNHDLSGSAAWSPDGSRMLLSRSAMSGYARSTPQVWVMSADGTDQRQLTTQGDGADTPAWG